MQFHEVLIIHLQRTAHTKYNFCCHGDCDNVCPTDSNFLYNWLKSICQFDYFYKVFQINNHINISLNLQPTEEIFRNVTNTAYTNYEDIHYRSICQETYYHIQARNQSVLCNVHHFKIYPHGLRLWSERQTFFMSINF